MMNPLMGEMRNPFRNGKIVGANVRHEDYSRQTAQRGDPDYSIGRGDLMEFARCPHRWVAGYESEETKQTEWGDLIDCLTLTPQFFKDDFAISPATYKEIGMQCPVCKGVTDSKSCRKCKTDRVPVEVEKDWSWQSGFCQDWKKEHKDLKIRTFETAQQGENAVKILYGKPETREVLECSERQVMAVAEYHHENGAVVPVRVLIDLVPRLGTPMWQSCLGDLKTCQSAGGGWTRKVFEWNYHVQAAFYLDVYNCAANEQRCEFVHVIQESYPPWEPARKPLSNEFIELGRWKYMEALTRYAVCLKENKWPGYDCGIVSPEPWMVQ